MGEIGITRVTPAVTHLALRPPVPGYESFIGAYVCRGEKTAIVDPGPAVAIPNLLRALEKMALSPLEIDYLVLTHIHQDHAGGAGAVLREMPNARVIVHGRGRRHIVDPRRLWEGSLQTLGELARQYGEIEPVPDGRIISAEDLMEIDLGRGVALQVHMTPGHAAHHLSLFERTGRVLLAGDAAGVWTSGALRPTNPPPFRLEDTVASLDRLKALRPRLVCYAHLGCSDRAVEMLEAVRRRTLHWHGVISAAAREGKSLEEILPVLRARDRSLDYMDGLEPDEYVRDHDLLMNTIRGMSGTP